MLSSFPIGVMRQVDAGDDDGERSREQVDRQRVAVHLGEERNDKGGEAAEGAPVTLRLRMEEADRGDMNSTELKTTSPQRP
jgi:hypothetical protein